MTSTMFTKYALKTTPPAPLNLLFQQASRWYAFSVLNALTDLGYDGLTEAQINLFANLQCGSTYASAVALQMGISRQAIYRTTTELQKMGFLQLEQDSVRRNQKIIVMTEKGNQFANDARRVLEQVEQELAQRITPESVQTMRRALESDWGPSCLDAASD